MNSPRARALLSLEGLSVGDALGEQFVQPWVVETARPDNLPPGPWRYTDDTAMAISVVDVLIECGQIHQPTLAALFAKRFTLDPHRGYGAGAQRLLSAIAKGTAWETVSRDLFGGEGSYGNGAAMRVAPLGAWFADDIEATIENARLSAEVTHSHAEAMSGAIAVALAAGWAWRWGRGNEGDSPAEMLSWIQDRLPNSEVRSKIETANHMGLDAWQFDVAREVGCGEQLSSQDTVPFCLWVAASSLDDFEKAIWTTARVSGDVDTTCAIVGGIVAASHARDGIPQEWLSRREPLTF